MSRRRRKGSNSRRRGPGSKGEADRKQETELAEQEIDCLWETYRATFATGNRVVGAIYARYSTRFQKSVADQVRALLEYAGANGIFVPREMIFFDLAVRGCREDRAGFSALRQELSAKSFKVLLVFASSRLFRKLHKSLRFFEEEIVEQNCRCICFSPFIDTADTKRWRMMLQMYGMMDENFSSFYAENIRASHKALARQRLVHNTLAVGYTGKPVEGPKTRRGKPRCEIVIDPAAAAYVKLVFQWFAVDLVTLDEIARRLNSSSDAPPPARSETGRWNHRSVRAILSNSRYRGVWDYGRTEAKWISSADYCRQVPRDEPLQTDVFEDLRIVSEELWHQAQQRLASMPTSGKRNANGTPRQSTTLLSGLFVCTGHKKPVAMYFGGAKGNSLFCPMCRGLPDQERAIFTLLNRHLALERTIDVVCELLRGDAELVHKIVQRCQAAADALQRPDAALINRLRADDTQLKQAIEFAMRNIGETAADQAETSKQIDNWRRERRQIQSQLGVLDEASKRSIRIPAPHEVETELLRMAEIISAVETSSPELVAQARALLDLVTGGSIEIVQLGDKRRNRGWLQGRFKCNLVDICASELSGCQLEAEGEQAVIFEFRRAHPHEALSQRAKALQDEGLLGVEIARRVGKREAQVTKYLQYWHTSRGLAPPDGRKRRAYLARKHAEPPLFERLAGPAMELYKQGLPIHDIGEQLCRGRHLITKAIRFWHESRGLPVPDGRGRRKELRLKRKSDADE